MSRDVDEPADRALRRGMHGHDVRVLQSWLTRLGQPTAVDGRFGRATRRSVERYERQSALAVDGAVSRLEAHGMRRHVGALVSQPVVGHASLAADGRTAVAPPDAPSAVQEAIAAANRIAGLPYRYGGGHGDFDDDAHDCSGAVSYMLHGAGLLDEPEDSSGLEAFGEPGRGVWITVYANGGHAYAVIAGLRFDTSGRGGRGPRWRPAQRSGHGYVVRHPSGL